MLVLLLSCSTTQNTSKKNKILLFDKNPGYLFEQVRKNDLRFDWVTAKYACEADFDGKSISLKANIKAKKDSVIWMSITPALGIEAARIKITSDSVFMINRINSTYFAGDFKFVNRMFNVESDFKMIQALLFGVNYTQFDESAFKSAIDDGNYLLSNIRKRKLRRTIQRNDSLDLEAQSIWLDPQSFRVSKFRFNDFSAKRELEANYSNFDTISGQLFPLQVIFSLRGDQQAKIQIQYSKVILNEPQSLPFTIPEKYEKIY
jgi:hypothetical protein